MQALARHGRPAIFRPDSGAQFTRAAFTGHPSDHGILTSMDGTGCGRDDIFVERLWRSLTYEEVYLRASGSVSSATAGVDRRVTLYNSQRPQSGLPDRTVDDAYCFPRPLPTAARPPPVFQLSARVRLYRKAEPLHSTVNGQSVTARGYATYRRYTAL